MEFFRIQKDIPFMRHVLVLNIISLITFAAAVFFLRPCETPLTNSSASSPEVNTCTGVTAPSRPGQVQCGRMCAIGSSGRQRAW